MFYVLVIAMIVGWYQGGVKLYRTHHGLCAGVEPSSNMVEFLLSNK